MWSYLIILTLVLIQVSGKDKECHDLINCRPYPKDTVCVSGGIYEPWAKIRCPAYCEFCEEKTSPVPCVDKLPNCDEYNADLCTNPLYRMFREDNCSKFCNLCTDNGVTAPGVIFG